MTTVGRLAPTPSGHLHLGNVLAFGAAWLSARSQGAKLLLRIEDLDRARARDAIAASQRADLRWLGLDWDQEVPAQSTRTYTLEGIPTYRCPCPRATRLTAPCGCRFHTHTEGAWRFRTPAGVVTFADRAHGPQRQAPTEDPILVRADGEAAYPLAVVLDDLRDGVTEVVRGGDLLEATGTQVALYGCLGHPAPTWLHTPVLLGPDGRKLSKSHGSTELRALRSAGWSAGRVWATLLPLLGLRGSDLRPEHFDPERVALGHFTVDGEGTVLGPSTAQKSL